MVVIMINLIKLYIDKLKGKVLEGNKKEMSGRCIIGFKVKLAVNST